MLTSTMLVDFCKKVYTAGWVYWYGTYGKQCTEKLYESKKKQYPAHYTASRASGYKKDIAEKKWCADCVGMIKAFFWTGGKFEITPVYKSNNCPDRSANGMFSLCTETGKIGTIPDIPGLVVWKDGHIGVYIGDGYTIEMRGFAYDCVKRKVSAGPWTKWGRLPASMISYTDVEIPDNSAVGLRKGDYGTAVEAMQKLLLKWKPDCLPKYGADGDFGTETEDAVKSFQAVTGLPATGIYDEATRTALTGYEPAARQFVEVTGNSVNVRSAPGAEGTRVLGVTHKGDKLSYQGEVRQVDGRDWYLVIYENENGWISSKYSRLVE